MTRKRADNGNPRSRTDPLIAQPKPASACHRSGRLEEHAVRTVSLARPVRTVSLARAGLCPLFGSPSDRKNFRVLHIAFHVIRCHTVIRFVSTDGTSDSGSGAAGHGTAATTRSQALSPEAWQALRYAIARLAIVLVAGPDRLASILRRGLLDAPYTSKPVVLDIGCSVGVPGHIRRAVQLRARGCRPRPGRPNPALESARRH